MRPDLIALVLVGCGGGYVDPYALVTVRVQGAPQMPAGSEKSLSLAAGFPGIDGGTPVGALLDGGYQWFANDGDTQWVAIGATVNWLASWSNAPGCTGSTEVSDAGRTISLTYDAGSCSHAYE